MSAKTRFLRRDPAAVQPWAETCGQIRCLIEEKDGAAGEVHRVRAAGCQTQGKGQLDRPHGLRTPWRPRRRA